MSAPSTPVGDPRSLQIASDVVGQQLQQIAILTRNDVRGAGRTVVQRMGIEALIRAN
ncbi:hypothetical protein [Pseudomonas sp. PS01303]|jgi:hypothetical protein|uniref:hypothetical protein n=1 Tax=Pseudomonas sp. PS01303 TaxID=2991439 RepID=UPI00249C5AEC|nr:hypothetical protein [Pseudomonas sp. PS01303]